MRTPTIASFLFLASLLTVAAGALALACSAQTHTSNEMAATEELERLRALGYVDYAQEQASPEQSGVTIHDRKRSYPGYNLYTIRPMARAELVDADGRLVHAWEQADGKYWTRSLLLPSGELLVVGSRPPERYLLKLSWDNRVIWREDLFAHHDVRPAPEGGLLTVTTERRRIPEIDPRIDVLDNSITRFVPRTGARESISLYDALVAGDFELEPTPVVTGAIDLLHANSVRPTRVASPHHAPKNVLFCMRHQDAVGILDWRRREVVWSWGPGELEGPHDATLLGNGNILIFDNGTRRKWSRVVEVDPESGAIVWEYRAPEPEDFFTVSRGAAQRLPNGNTLITESNKGRAFEVTRQGRTVWEYRVPHFGEKGRRAVIVRCYRYEHDLVRPLLQPGSDPGP